MRTLRILHAADLHLDSPFDGLTAAKAAVRRSELIVFFPGKIRRLSGLQIILLLRRCGQYTYTV